MGRFKFDSSKRFIIEDYQKAKPFSSFLPGIAGINGIPMWVFYVNRGQGIASFGVENKNGSIMEFTPADKSYHLVSTKGFRTFIKLLSGKTGTIIEPFSPLNRKNSESMAISMNKLEFESIDPENGLKVNVSYFTLPNENLAALVRKVSIQNLSASDKEFELLDGLSAILPYGIDDSTYKTLGNTIKAWMDVYNMDHAIPYYRVRASIVDSSEVSEVTSGHFYLSFVPEEPGKAIKPVVDADLIFGENSSMQYPDQFAVTSIGDLLSRDQQTVNKVPCGFTGLTRKLASGQTTTLYTLIGNASSVDIVNSSLSKLTDPAVIEQKMVEASGLINELTDMVDTHTASDLFDSYARQCYLDNVLRGGYPLLLENGKKPFVYHVYSRKHGDLERDYNFFSLAAEFYSQGNGNFRDANQNRRNDPLFAPGVEDFNLKMFMSLLQTDGYNPLVVKGCTFSLSQDGLDAVLPLIPESSKDRIAAILKKPFTPGKLVKAIVDNNIKLSISTDALLTQVLQYSEQNIDADFGEGYWSDHWTYNMDLLDSYLAIYPDNKEKILFEDKSYRYYDSFAFAAPRKDKYVLVNDKIRQYDAIIEDHHKKELIKKRGREATWVRTQNGNGEVYQTSLFEKLFCLALTKFTTLDPQGMGVEMEGDKPGWDDSMNGLPGLFGSSIPESYELKRILLFLLDSDKEQGDTEIPEEMADLLAATEVSLAKYDQTGDDFTYWDEVYTARESYREKTQYGLSGKLVKMQLSDLKASFDRMLKKLDKGLKKANNFGGGLSPTYFTFEATDFELIKDDNGQIKTNHKGRQNVRVKAFKPRMVTHFLEGIVKALKMSQDITEAQNIYNRVKGSAIYDEKLKMYKVCSPLTLEPFESGRCKAFTPGWLENESIFTHMEYKYLLEVLKTGQYEAFYEDMKHVLVPFMDPEVYGRSTLENSSFIASSANPDPTTHGKGYVARLSGSTAEFLSMWFIMMAGKKPFTFENNTLSLTLSPILPGWLFNDAGEVAFRFLGSCKVVYRNPGRKNTYGSDGVSIKKIELILKDGSHQTFENGNVPAPFAQRIRNSEAAIINCTLG